MWNYYSNIIKPILIIIPHFTPQGKWTQKGLSNLPKVTQWWSRNYEPRQAASLVHALDLNDI